MSATVSTPTRAALDGVPHVDVAGSLRTAIMSGGRIGSIIREALRRGAGQLTMAEYCYYRMWEGGLPLAVKRRFVGKRVPQAMHLACNDYGWSTATEEQAAVPRDRDERGPAGARAAGDRPSDATRRRCRRWLASRRPRAC